MNTTKRNEAKDFFLNTTKLSKVLSLQGQSKTDEFDTDIDSVPVFELWTNGFTYYWKTERRAVGNGIFKTEVDALKVFESTPQYTWHII